MRTVLLVLRSEEFRAAVQAALEKDFRVIGAADAAAGAALLRDMPDILLLDLFLPGTDGLCFLEENRSLLPPEIVLFTTLRDPQLLQAASELGVKSVFLKPCSLSAVVNYLKALP